MKGKSSMALLGAFVLVAVFLTCFMLYNLKSDYLFGEQATYHVHVDRSLKGLSIGAPVTFRGIKIGQVTQIRLMPLKNLADKQDDIAAMKNGTYKRPPKGEEVPNTWPLQIDFTIDYEAIAIQIEDETEMRHSKFDFYKKQAKAYFDKLSPKQHTDNWVETMVVLNNLAAKLKISSLLTGQLYIDLDFDPTSRVTDAEIAALKTGELPMHETAMDKLRTAFDSRETIESLNKSIKIFSDTINSGKLEETIKNVHSAIESFNETAKTASKTMNDVNAKLNPLLDNANNFVVKLQNNVDNVEKSFNELSQEIKKLAVIAQTDMDLQKGPLAKTIVNCNKVLAQMNETLASTNVVLQSLQYNQGLTPTTQTTISRLIIQLEESARSAKALTDMLRETPEVLIQGK